MASSPPGIIGAQPTWVPYEPTRDCSQGLCSTYCPQWCYFIFPPPPPFDLAGPSPDDSSGHVFSPLVIAIIGVLASAFLLVSYYTFISKYSAPSVPSGEESSAPAPAALPATLAAAEGAARGSPGAKNRGTSRHRVGWMRP